MVFDQVHARRGRGAPGPQVREYSAYQQLQRAHSRLRVRPVRGPRPEPGRGHRVWHAGVLVAGAGGGHAAVQPGGLGRLGHWCRAVHDGQQRGAVPGQEQRGDVQEAGEWLRGLRDFGPGDASRRRRVCETNKTQTVMQAG